MELRLIPRHFWACKESIQCGGSGIICADPLQGSRMISSCSSTSFPGVSWFAERPASSKPMIFFRSLDTSLKSAMLRSSSTLFFDTAKLQHTYANSPKSYSYMRNLVISIWGRGINSARSCNGFCWPSVPFCGIWSALVEKAFLFAERRRRISRFWGFWAIEAKFQAIDYFLFLNFCLFLYERSDS